MASKQENREADVRQETALILKERLRAWQRRGKSFLVAVVVAVGLKAVVVKIVVVVADFKIVVV